MIPLGIGVSLISDRFLPPEVLELEDKQFENFMDFTHIDARSVLLMIVGTVLFSVWVVSTIGLLKFRKWGAWLYLALNIFSLPFYFMGGFDVRHPGEVVFDDVYRFIPGFIIGLAFFSDAIPKSNREQDVAPNV